MASTSTTSRLILSAIVAMILVSVALVASCAVIGGRSVGA